MKLKLTNKKTGKSATIKIYKKKKKDTEYDRALKRQWRKNKSSFV
jgi:hypothetical protein